MKAKKHHSADEILEQASPFLAAQERFAEDHRARLLADMRAEMHQGRDLLEHQLLNISLGLLVYTWIILRMKSKPWRILVPASFGVWIVLMATGAGRIVLSWLQTGVF